MESLPSPGMGSRSAVMVSSLLPVAVIGELFNQTTTATVQSSTPVNGQVIGCPPRISVEVALVILVVLTSASPISVSLVPLLKAQNRRNAPDHSLLLRLHQLQVLLLEELVRLRLARTTMEQICSLLQSTQAVRMSAAANVPPTMVAWATLGSMTTVSVG